MRMHYDHEEFRQALAKRIRALREAKGWSDANDNRFWLQRIVLAKY
jgi:hypothetical protein